MKRIGVVFVVSIVNAIGALVIPWFVCVQQAENRTPFSRAIVQQYRSVLESGGLASPSINLLRLSAIRKLAAEAAENGLLDRSVAQGIVSLKGVSHSGDRTGNWLSREQARDLLAQPDSDTTEGKRDRAILAVFLDCALRRSELAALELTHIQQRDGRLVFVDLVGKGKRVRTVPIPPFVKVAIDAWTAAAGLSQGPYFGGCVAESIRKSCEACTENRPACNIDVPARDSSALGRIPGQRDIYRMSSSRYGSFRYCQSVRSELP